jgi:holo-[acyl-carrier protein] synthase
VSDERVSPRRAAGIVGVGVDAVDVARFRRVLERRPRFAARYFTPSEQSDAGSSADTAQSLAARFAAKEAVMKALGTGIGSFALTDVEVRRAPGTGATRNAPSLVLHGTAAALAGAQGAGRFHLSLTHTDALAIAFVVAEHGGPGSSAGQCAPS